MEKLRAYEICNLIRLECEMGKPDVDRLAYWVERLRGQQAEEQRFLDAHTQAQARDPVRYS